MCHLEELLFGVVLNQVSVNPTLPVAQTVPGNRHGQLGRLEAILQTSDLTYQQVDLICGKTQRRC